MMTNPLNRFLSRQPRLFLWRRDGLRPGKQGPGSSFIVASRGLCRFRSFGKVEGQSAAQRHAALNLKIRSWAPFPDANYVSVAAGDRHMVWAWSAGEAANSVAASGLKLARATILPETLFQETSAEGVRLVSCMDGIEGQVWAEGALIESRWWADTPSESEWIAFQRAAGLKPDRMSAKLPRILRPQWLERPWGGAKTNLIGVLQRMEPVEWAIALGVVFLAPLVFLMAESLHISARLNAVDEKIAALEQNAGPVLEAQSRALTAIERIKRLASLDPYPPQIEVMAKVASALPDDGTRLVDWSYQNGDLTIAVSKPAGQIDLTSYVRRFQDAGFPDTSVDTSNPQQLKVMLKVVPKH